MSMLNQSGSRSTKRQFTARKSQCSAHGPSTHASVHMEYEAVACSSFEALAFKHIRRQNVQPIMTQARIKPTWPKIADICETFPCNLKMFTRKSAENRGERTNLEQITYRHGQCIARWSTQHTKPPK